MPSPDYPSEILTVGQNGSVEIDIVNKNLLDIANTEETIKDGITYSIKNGILKLNGTATANFDIQLSKNIKIKKGKYTHSSSYIQPGLYVSFDNLGNTMISAQVGKKRTFEITKDTTYKTYFIWIDKGTVLNNVEIKLQLEAETTATDFVEHQSQSVIMPIQQEMLTGDYISNVEHHEWEKLVLTGDEKIAYSVIQNDYIIFQIIPNQNMIVDSEIISNYFKNQPNWNKDIESVYAGGSSKKYIQIKILNSRLSEATQRGIRAWLKSKYDAGTPVVIYYKLLIPVSLELTEEQKAVRENKLYTYKGTTHIFSTDETSPIFDVSAYKRISEEFKQRLLNGKITRAYLKVLATDTKPEMIIDENNYLKDCTFEELRYVPNEGFIGGTVAKRVTGNFNNVDSSFSIQDREFELYIGVDLENGTTEYIKYGTFIVQKPEDDQVNDNTSFEALDYMIKLNLPWVDRMAYPCTLKELFDDLVAQSGLSTKVTSFLNQDFIVENNQFEEGTTRRDVLKAIAQMAFNWARIDEDNDIVMDFEKKDEIVETLTADNYYNFKKQDMYGPINVIILRNSQVEGENITIRDEKSIAQYGETELVISDNPFAYTQSKRAKLIEAGRILFGLTYVPMSMDMIGYMYLNCKDKIKATNLNNETFETYLLNHTIEYTGTISDSMEAPATTKTETKYQFTPQMIEALKHTELLIDKANQRIIEVVEKQTDFSNELTKQETSLSGISQQVSKIYDFKKSVKGIYEIVLEDALPTNILKFEAIAKNVVGIYPKKTIYPSPKLYPKKGGATLTLVFGRTSRGSIPDPILPKKTLYPSSTLYPRADGSYIREYSFYIANPLREYLGKHDIFRVENDTEKGITVVKVIRYVKYENGQYGLYDEPIEEIIDDTQQLQLFKGNNFVYIKEFTDWDISADYIFNNELNKQYAPRVETNANIKTLNNEIELKVSEKVGKDEVITAINLTPEKAKIKSKNLELEGITTINGGFSIDEKGNASIANDTVKINEKGIQLADGASLVGGEGLITNLQFYGKVTHVYGAMNTEGYYDALGFEVDELTAGACVATSCTISADLPKNFTVVSAYVTIKHYPTKFYFNNNHGWGYSRKLKLYQRSSSSMYREYNIFGGALIPSNYGIEVPNAFGEENFTPSIPNDTSQKVDIVTSIDLTEYLSSETNYQSDFIIRSSDTPPAYTGDQSTGIDYVNCGYKTGMVMAVLNVYGYLRLENKEE